MHSYIVPTANTFENIGWFNVVNYKMNDRFIFNHALNLGVSGDKTADMNIRKIDLENIDADMIFVLGGTNDITTQTPASTIINNLFQIYDYILNTLNKTVLAQTILPRSYWPATFTQADINNAKADIITVNNWIKSQTGVYVIDSYNAWNNGSDEPISGYTTDGLHCSAAGANAIADTIIPLLSPLFGTGVTPLSLNGNLLTNGSVLGTAGTIPNGFNGTLPSGFTAQALGSSSNNSWRTFSKTAEDYLKIDINVPQGNGVVGLTLSERINEGSDYQNGIPLKAACEMNIESLSPNFESVNYEIRHEGGASGNEYIVGLDEQSGDICPAYGPGICRTPDFIPSDSTRLCARIMIEGDTTSQALLGTIIIKNIFLGLL